MEMTYKNAGVDYDPMDHFKRHAQRFAQETASNIHHINDGEFVEVRCSRGESAFLIETPDGYIAHVEEGLGTKNLVADAMYALTGKSYYDQIAQCTVAMIINDMITVGASPLSVAMHLASGTSEWFRDENRSSDLIKGWKHACDLACCVWGGGETPTLKGVVNEGAVVLSGSAVGIIKPKNHLITDSIEHGDVIVIVESSGIHANGLTLARKIAEKLPKGYLTTLSDGRTYGETLLEPTHIYVPLLYLCRTIGVDIHYAVNVTGHGWRKFMRVNRPFTYVIETLPTQLPIFDFMINHGPIDEREAYADFNMGAGFALYLKESDAGEFVHMAHFLGFNAFIAGHIESGEKKLIIKPKGIEFSGDTLQVR